MLSTKTIIVSARRESFVTSNVVEIDKTRPENLVWPVLPEKETTFCGITSVTTKIEYIRFEGGSRRKNCFRSVLLKIQKH